MEGETLKFAWKDQDGNTVKSSDLKGEPYVLYFYPKDDTPGCTKEACAIRDAWQEFQDAGLRVYGVSLDDEASHQRFRQKYELPFDLLVADKEDLEALGVFGTKSMYGRSYEGIKRETFLVDAEGKVAKHYKKVKPQEHAEELLQDFQSVAQR